MKRRILSLILAFVFMVTLLPIGTMNTLAAPAAEQTKSSEAEIVTYPVPGGSIYFDPVTGTVTGFEGEITEFNIPAEIDGVDVVAIGESAFYNCDSLTNITFPDSLETIGSYAFEDCDGLFRLTIPNGVTTINSYAFYWCYGLEKVEIPDSVTFIGEDAFYYCINLTDIYYVGSEEQWSGIDMDYNDFSGAEIHFNATMPELLFYPVPDGGIYFEPATGTVTGYAGEPGTLNIPAEFDGVPVVAIGNDAFFNCDSLTDITFPDSLKTIGDWAFGDCDNLFSISLPYGVTTIGAYAFSVCYYLNDITIPDSVTTIGEESFSHCSYLSNVTIPDSVASIGAGAFAGCTMLEGIWVDENNPNYCSDENGVLFSKDKTEVVGYPGAMAGDYTIPDGVTAIGDYAFAYCYSIERIEIPDSVTTIGDFAFANCYNMASIEIPDSVTSIGDYAFYDCESLTNINIPDGLTRIGNGIFQSCYGLSDITIPGSVTTIGDFAFTYCGNLTSVTIPDGVTTIGAGAFDGCYSLSSVEIPVSVTYIGYDVFYDCYNLTDLYYGGSEEQWYEIDMDYNGFNGAEIHFNASMPVPYPVPGGGIYFDPVTGAVTGYVGEITELNIPAEIDGVPVVAIGNYAFYNCDSLTAITFPDSLETIGSCAFEDCDGLSILTIPNGVTTIGSYAFYWCWGLKKAEIPDSVTFIGEDAFYDCGNLTDIYYVGSEEQWYEIEQGYNDFSGAEIHFNASMPAPVEPIFYPVPGGGIYFDPETGTVTGYEGDITEVDIPAEIDGVPVVAIAGGAFSNCSSLANITIPDGVTGIDWFTFADCYNLTTVTIPVSVTWFGDWAFDGCDALTDIYYGGSRTQWEQIEQNINDLNDAVIHFTSNETEYPVPGGIIYFEPETGTVTGYAGEITELNIPAEINSVSVIAIGDDAFEYCYNLTSITFPDSLTTIGEYAFIFCDNLTSVIIPDGVTTIGDGAFQNCYSLSDVTIPGSVTYIGATSFLNCGSLTKVTIPDGVTTIGAMAFDSCYSLTSIEIPASVTTIGFDAFFDCHNLTDIYYGGSEEQWEQIDQNMNDFNGATIHYNGTTPDPCVHDYEAVVTEPTCDEAGYTTYTCSCGDSYVADEVPALGHKYENGFCTVCGEEDPNYVPETMVITVGSIVAKSGETIVVPVSVENNAGIAGYTFVVSSDAGLTLADITKGSLSQASESGILTVNAANGQVNWTDSSSLNGDGELILLTIEVAEDAADGDYGISIAVKGGSAMNFVNADAEPIEATFVSGVVTVKNVIYGDVNNDGEVTSSDSVMLARYLVDLEELSEKQLIAADVNHDGDVSAADAVVLAKFLVGMVDSLDAPGTKFADAPARDSWAYAGIDYCISNGLMQGNSKSTFNSQGTLTRAELVTILYRVAGEPEVAFNDTFVDVVAGQWYSDAIEWAAANGIVNGIDNGKFDPTGKITREQIATILYRYNGAPEVAGSLDAYPDVAAVSSFAVDAMIWATSEGIITGTSVDGVVYLAPQALATREQIAAIIMRYCELAQ